MDTAEIEVFLVLAEELHFGRTAERLRMPQPRVSRLVAALEHQVGGSLFERTMLVRDDIALIPIKDLPPLRLGLIWCTAHDNARIQALAETARTLPHGPAREADRLADDADRSTFRH
jgi:hypothetical protein